MVLKVSVGVFITMCGAAMIGILGMIGIPLGSVGRGFGIGTGAGWWRSMIITRCRFRFYFSVCFF